MRTLAISNQKGGCGKTASTYALGEVLASRGYRTLMVDADPQGTLTTSCHVRDTAGHSLAEVLGNTEPGTLTISDVAREIAPNLHLTPSDVALASSELGLFLRMAREMQLREALAAVADDYDVALLDCSPSLGLLVINALAAADAVLIPCIPQEADLRGLQLFLRTLDKVRAGINRRLQILGIVAVMYDARTIHHRSGLQAMIDAGLPVLPVTIGKSIRVAESVALGRSVVSTAPRNPRSAEYQRLAEEVIRWLDGPKR